MDGWDLAKLISASLGIKALIALAAILIAYQIARSGARFFHWIARLTEDPRDDAFWRSLARAWWLLALVALVSFLFRLFELRVEPLYTWGELLIRWIGSRGLSFVLILILTYAAYRMVDVLASRFRVSQGPFERKRVRKETLVNVVQSTLKGLVITIGAITALANLGVNVGALLAGAGIAGLAVSFAAQNLVRDLINGFFILLEDQYGVGDIIKVGNTAGGVERMNLRLTVLRDLEGKVHFIPNGQINQVTVMSRDWSRALVDVGVAYKEDIDRVLEVVRDEAEKLFADWRDKFTNEHPQVLGVNELGDSAVVIRVLFTTKPKEQWDVAREFYRRIKKRFDAEGIEIPFPQRTVWFPEPLRIEKA